jgi:hypothetical protein
MSILVQLNKPSFTILRKRKALTLPAGCLRKIPQWEKADFIKQVWHQFVEYAVIDKFYIIAMESCG